MTETENPTHSENIMGTQKINTLLLSMSIPMMISMMVQALYNIVDSIFVAQIGEDALAALTLAFPIQSLMIGVSVGTGVGINALLSRSLGARNYEAVNKSATNGLFLVWVSSIVFILFGVFFARNYFSFQTDDITILNYGEQYLSIVCIFSIASFNQITFERLLSSTGKTFYMMITQSAGAVINIILDPIMIFGLLGFPKMGVTGAALATGIGQSCAALLAFYFNMKVNHEIKVSFKKFRPDGKIIKTIYAVGVPSILMQSLGSVMMHGLNVILLSFTKTAVAVFGVYFRLQSFVFMPIFGMNNALVPIVAYNYGAKNKKRIIKTIKLSALYATGIMFLGFLVFEVIPDKLLFLFSASGQMLSIGVPAMRIIAIHFLFAGFCIVFISVLQALGNGVESLIIGTVRQLIALLPAAWLLSLMGNVNNVWWAFPIAEVIALLLSVFFIRRTYVHKIKDLVE